MKRREKLWREKWEKREKTIREEGLHLFPLWSYEYELMYSILIKENVVSRGNLCLETGSGSGRMSLKLGEEGVKPILLDVSREAIKFSKKLAHVKNVEADFVVGSILCLPFRSSSLDVVWNQGVLEHFVRKEQELIINESLRVLKTKGKLIVIVPHRKALFYNFFRILSMKLKTWPFGYEEPLTIEDFEKFSPKPITFHSCGWIFCQFSHVFIPGITPAIKRLIIVLEHLLKSNFIAIEKSRPGLILAAVWVR